MAEKRLVYGDVENKTDLEEIFREIRGDVDKAKSRAGLTELYRRAGYLITLTHAPSWKKKFGSDASKLRSDAESEFTKTAHAINKRAKEIGEDGDYDDKWGD